MERKLIIGGGILVGILGLVFVFRRKINAAMGNYFTIDELTYSSVAKQKGLSNTPNLTERINLSNLIAQVLNPIREKYGKPIIVSSGFRSEAVNNAVGGSKTSQHRTGCAADLQPAKGGSLADIFRAAVACNNYDQLIIEDNGTTKWVHVSYSAKPRRQMLAYKNKTYIGIDKSNYEAYLG